MIRNNNTQWLSRGKKVNSRGIHQRQYFKSGLTLESRFGYSDFS